MGRYKTNIRLNEKQVINILNNYRGLVCEDLPHLPDGVSEGDLVSINGSDVVGVIDKIKTHPNGSCCIHYKLLAEIKLKKLVQLY